MINFLHTFNPSPILFKLGPLQIHWYGFLIVCGAVLGFLAVLHLAKRYGVSQKTIYDLTFYLIIFGLIGDRLYYVFYAWDYYSRNLLDIFKIWQGGLAIHGAMIAGLITIYIYAKKKKINPWFLADIFIIALPIAMALGRWGNYFNQELFGRPTNLPWGIPIELANRPAGFLSFAYFQPTFLYESILNLLIFFILFGWHLFRLRKQKTATESGGSGNITLAFLILYSVNRFFLEFLRLDYSPMAFGLRWAQAVSLAIILICFALIFRKAYKRFKQPAIKS